MKVFDESLYQRDLWIVQTQCKAYNRFDSFLSYLRLLTFRQEFSQQVLPQFITQNPLNHTSLLVVRLHSGIKSMRFLVVEFVKVFQHIGDEQYRTKGYTVLQWLQYHHSIVYSGLCCADDFDYLALGLSSRGWTINRLEGLNRTRSSFKQGHRYLKRFIINE